MNFCSHFTAIKNIGKICNAIISKINRFERKKISARCSECIETSDLRICLKCHHFLCSRDRRTHNHPVVFNPKSIVIYCRQCSRSYLADGLMNKLKKMVHIRIPTRMYKIIPYTPVKGLSNLGNTCYMNAVLAILLNLDPIRDNFLSDDHKRVNCGNEGCTICAMKSLFEYLYSPGYILAHRFVYSFWRSAPQFMGFKQHDAHDFFISLLQKLHEVYNPEITNEANCKCLPHQTFSGIFSSEISCERCGFCKTTEDPFTTIPLEFSSSIQSSLDEFFKPEILSDKMMCNICTMDTYWSKKLGMKRHPNTLTLHLKRFSYDTVARKIDSNVLLLDSVSVDNKIYDIFGFVNHSGTIDYGHYFSYVLLNNVWYKIDDEAVSIVPRINIPGNGSYIIYYTSRKLS